MKITTFDVKITPEAGAEIAGYGSHDTTWAIHDDLWCCGLLMDNNSNRVAILSFDLVGMDHVLIEAIRKGCAAHLETAEEAIVLSCTHTHGGPHTRSNDSVELFQPYCDEMVQKVVAAFGDAVRGAWTDTEVYFYSAAAHVNINRRYCGPENVCRMLFSNRSLEPLADGITDPEVGMLFFRDKITRCPVEILVNYAAHPLASHCRGLGGHAITADYPGMVRELIRENTGSHCTFVSGACGDQFPVDSEIGWQNLDTIAKPIVREVLRGLVDAFENPDKFRMPDELKTLKVPFHTGVSPRYNPARRRPYLQKVNEYKMDLQLLAVGEICLVGVPGELLAEVGLEIKWHSPFRRAYILYNSTDYLNYICPVNAFVAGGYEPGEQELEYRAGLKLVNTAVEAMFQLRGETL